MSKPSYTNEKGAEVYRDGEGNLHREDGPAVITEKGSKYWYRHGKRHREDGPAAEWWTGNSEWYFNNIHIPVKTLKEFQVYIRNKAFW